MMVTEQVKSLVPSVLEDTAHLQHEFCQDYSAIHTGWNLRWYFYLSGTGLLQSCH